MDTKNTLLELFEKNKGKLISGEEIARYTGVSRTAIWKAVEALRKEGAEIESVSGGGYIFQTQNDILLEGALQAWLQLGYTVDVYKELESTNTIAKTAAIKGAAHGSVYAAHQQISGRGRLGRKFESPKGGVYFSVVLKKDGMPIQDAVLVTTAASVAVHTVVQNLLGISLGIKWVNDLFLNNKKCCGILTEAGTNFETGNIDYIVVGIGIDYKTLPEHLDGAAENIACSLCPDGKSTISRARLIAEIHTLLLQEFAVLEQKQFLPAYRKNSILLGKHITVLTNPPYEAKAIEIDDNAQLVIETQSGNKKTLSSGEVSVKL